MTLRWKIVHFEPQILRALNQRRDEQNAIFMVDFD